jgi:hypothetical protein
LQGDRDELGARPDVRARCRVRVAAGLLIDTGRRPEGICALPLDFLARDSDMAPVPGA